MTTLAPKLIGYFARPTTRRTNWPHAETVEEICNASTCMSGCDWDWINEWRHNEMWMFDSPEIALEVVPVERRTGCDLYAYQLFPVRFVESQRESYVIPAVSPAPLDTSFERLGYDLVSRSQDNKFECSPLSCNDLAAEVPVNRHCLLDTAEAAFALAETIEIPGQPMRGEPGPYFIVEVWRRRASGSGSMLAL